MTSITLNRPTNKQEEYEFLEKIAAMLKGGGTYLEELFTPEMVNDMQGRIRNDFPCNLYQDFRDQAAVADSKMDLANSLKRDYDNLETTMNARLNEAREAIAQRQETIDKLEATIQAGSDRMAAACETTQQAYNEVSQLQNALSNREMEICQLKAKLYDLEHK